MPAVSRVRINSSGSQISFLTSICSRAATRVLSSFNSAVPPDFLECPAGFLAARTLPGFRAAFLCVAMRRLHSPVIDDVENQVYGLDGLYARRLILRL